MSHYGIHLKKYSKTLYASIKYARKPCTKTSQAPVFEIVIVSLSNLSKSFIHSDGIILLSLNHFIRLIIFFVAKDGEALYSQQKQDQELTVAQIMSSLLQSVSHSVVSDSLRPHGLSMESFRQKYWSRLPFPPPGDLPYPGFELASPEAPELQSDFFFFFFYY